MTYTPKIGTIGTDSFQYTVTSPGGASATGTAEINVLPTVYFQPADNALNQGTTIAVTICLSQATSVPVTIDYATGNSTAVAGTDYTGASGVLAFSPGQTAATINLATLSDSAATDDLKFELGLSGATNAVLASTSTMEYFTILAPPTADRTGDLNSNYDEINTLLGQVSDLETQVDGLINGEGGLAALREQESWQQYDAVYGTMVNRIGTALDKARQISRKATTAVADSQGESFRYEGVRSMVRELESYMGSIKDMLVTERDAYNTAVPGDVNGWEDFQNGVNLVGSAIDSAAQVLDNGPGPVPDDAPATVAQLNTLSSQVRFDIEQVYTADSNVEAYVAAMNRWIDRDEEDTDPSYSDLVLDMANSVSTVSEYAGGLTEDGTDVSAAAQLNAAKAVDGVMGDSFATRGIQTWVTRFQNVLLNEAWLAQGQINYLESEGYGGSANAESFGSMQGLLGTAYDNFP